MMLIARFRVCPGCSFGCVCWGACAQDFGEPAVCGEVEGEKDQVHWGAGEEGPDTADRGHYAISTAYASPGMGLFYSGM